MVEYPIKNNSASVASFIVIVLGMCYGVLKDDIEIILLVTGAAIGFLFRGSSFKDDGSPTTYRS